MPQLDTYRDPLLRLMTAWRAAHQRSTAEWMRRMEAKPRDVHLSR